MNVIQLFKTGGVVMLPLLILSVISLAMILERSLFWWRLSRRQTKLLERILNLYRDDVEMSKSLLERNRQLPIARIFLVAISLKRSTPQKFELALESAVQAEIPVLKRFNNAFGTIISMAPLLGLLGTVLGLITSLGSLKIGDFQQSQATGVTSGIGEALVSTAAGLVVALFTLFFASTFKGLYSRQLATIQEYGGRLELLHLDKYERQQSEFGVYSS